MRTGLNLVKTDVHRTDIVIVYLELTKDGLITSEKRLYEFNDKELYVRNYTKMGGDSIYYFKTPEDYLKIYNTVCQIVMMGGSINMLNSLLKRFVGDILLK